MKEKLLIVVLHAILSIFLLKVICRQLHKSSFKNFGVTAYPYVPNIQALAQNLMRIYPLLPVELDLLAYFFLPETHPEHRLPAATSGTTLLFEQFALKLEGGIAKYFRSC